MLHIPLLTAEVATIVAVAPLAPCIDTPVAKFGLMSRYSATAGGSATPSVTRPSMSSLEIPASAIANPAASAHKPYILRPSWIRLVGTSPMAPLPLRLMSYPPEIMTGSHVYGGRV